LFDMVSDPKEKHNLIGTPRGKELLPRLKSELEKIKATTGYIGEL